MISPVHTWVAEKTGLGGTLNPLTLSEWQQEKWRQMVRYARAMTRFYRDLPEVGDISQLPFTTPADFAKDALAFLAIPQSEVARITTLTTSGTTGPRKRICFSAGDIDRIREYFAVGMSTLTGSPHPDGVPPPRQGPPTPTGSRAAILLSDDTVNSLGYLLREALATIGVTARILPPVTNAGEAIALSQDARFLVGLPSELLYLCRIAPGLRPDRVLLTADYVPESVIVAIRETWKCEVFTHYGMTETGFGYAVDCPSHCGHHTRDADILVEIIDPQTGLAAHPGEPGEIVLTMLSNEAMPLIRYRTGDRSRFLSTPCPCGSNLLRLDRIESRFADQVILTTGEPLNIRMLDEWMFSQPAVRAFNASYSRVRGEDRLHLSADTTGPVDLTDLKAGLPGNLVIRLDDTCFDPFTQRGKRTLQTETIPALILASGWSERMGQPKALLKWDPAATFLERIISQYLEAGCNRVVCTVNRMVMPFCETLPRRPEVLFVLNEHPEWGRMHSIKIGLQELKESPFCLLQNVDNPFVTAEMIRTILDERDPAAWTSPEYQGRGGHPVVLPQSIIRHILEQTGPDIPLRDILLMFPCKRVEVEDDSILRNINTPDDLSRFQLT